MRHVIQSNGSDYFIIVKDGKAVVRSLDNQDLFPSTYTDIIYDDNGGFIVIDAN